MTLLDYTVFAGYLVLVVGIGFYFREKNKSEDDFFLASRSMHWFPIGISVMVTVFSAINYVAFPSEVFANGLYVTIAFSGFILVAFPITRIFMPFFHRMQLTSAYEYLERRFDLRVRLLAGGLFILWRIAWMAVAVYASGKFLSLVTGLDFRLVVILAGLAATAYTAAGGIRAVMWTDVAQFFVLFGGIIAATVIAVNTCPDGFSGVIATAREGGLFKPAVPFDPEFFSPHPSVRISFFSGVIGVFVAFMARYGADQVVLQRYFSARSLKAAQRGFYFNIVCALFCLFLLVVFGLAIFAFTRHSGLTVKQPPAAFAALVKAMPSGMAGLIAAGLLAATMSSLDSGINACIASYATDFHHRLKAEKSKDFSNIGDRFLSLVLGLLTVGAALGLKQVLGEKSIFVIVNRIILGMGSPLLALITLGMFSRRANASGMFLGGLGGTAFSVYVSLGSFRLGLHYYAVVNLLGTVAACLFFSILAEKFGHRSTDEQLEWTWRARKNLQ